MGEIVENWESPFNVTYYINAIRINTKEFFDTQNITLLNSVTAFFIGRATVEVGHFPHCYCSYPLLIKSAGKNEVNLIKMAETDYPFFREIHKL